MAKKETSKVELKKIGEPEKGVESLTADTVKTQVASLLQQLQFQTDLFSLARPDVLEQLRTGFGTEAALTVEDPTAQALRSSGATSQLLGLELERAGTGVATPEQSAAINRAATLAIEAGASDIQRAASEQLRSLRQELAPQLGLRSGDSPILERGARVGEEALRQTSQLIRNVRQSEAEQNIQASLAQGQLNQGLLGINLQATGDIQQRAIQNRLLLLQTAGQLGLGLGGVQNIPASLSVLQQPRLTETKTVGTSKPPLAPIILGGIGGLLSSGGGSLASSGGGAGGGGGGGSP